MDHSYRVANGNMADGPPSTIEFRNVNGNRNGNGYHPEPIVPEPMPIPVREDAPTRIFFFIEDLFFLAKIQETAKKLGVKVGFLKADKDIVARLTNVPEEERPSLIVFDLNNAGAKPLTLIPKIKAKLKRGTSVIGFPLSPAGRPEGEGDGSGLRHGDAAFGVLTELAQPSPAPRRGRGIGSNRSLVC